MKKVQKSKKVQISWLRISLVVLLGILLLGAIFLYNYQKNSPKYGEYSNEELIASLGGEEAIPAGLLGKYREIGSRLLSDLISKRNIKFSDSSVSISLCLSDTDYIFYKKVYLLNIGDGFTGTRSYYDDQGELIVGGEEWSDVGKDIIKFDLSTHKCTTLKRMPNKVIK